MDVSVVIPAKNEEGVIGNCLERIEQQVTASDEILVLDNGSEDATAYVAETFESVTVIDAPDDSVPPTLHYRGNLDGIRQMGAEMASNEIIISTDADTLPPDGWIDRIRQHFEEDPDLDLVWGVPVDINGVPLRNIESKFANVFGAVSGCNTAFRKSTFQEMKRGYVGWPLYEDAAIVNRMARIGKVKRDTSMEMPTDMERTRFQTIPILVGSGLGLAGGQLLGGTAGRLIQGVSVGLSGTELVYENAPATRFHHDQVGLGMMTLGTFLGGPVGIGAAGLGSGILGHHAMTEGVSAIPTPLMENTDAVCRIPQDAEEGITAIECTPPDEETASFSRVLAGITMGSLAGAAVAALS